MLDYWMLDAGHCEKSAGALGSQQG